MGQQAVQYCVGQRARGLLKVYHAVVRLKKVVKRHVPAKARKRAELRRDALDGAYERVGERGLLCQNWQLLLLWL